MRLLLDTNIVIDVLSKRSGYESSLGVLRFCELRLVEGFISTITAADAMYVLRKYLTQNGAKEAMRTLLHIADIADVVKSDIGWALDGCWKDFEDAVQAACAARYNIDYIVTRNTKDFAASPVKTISPADALVMLRSHHFFTDR